MTAVEKIREQIEEKQGVIERVPALRKEIKTLRKQLEHAEAMELLDVMREKGVTVPDVRSAVERGIVKSSAAKTETVTLNTDRNEKQEL